jgi:limonene-1,2-epoxide hydrolase
MVAPVISAFLAAFDDGVDALAPFLADDIAFQAGELPVLHGRLAVLGFWRRLFQTYRRIEMTLVLHIVDGDMVVAEQRQCFTPRTGEIVRIDSVSVYRLQGGLIANWSDYMELDDLPLEQQALWRRLWAARW